MKTEKKDKKKRAIDAADVQMIQYPATYSPARPPVRSEQSPQSFLQPAFLIDFSSYFLGCSKWAQCLRFIIKYQILAGYLIKDI